MIVQLCPPNDRLTRPLADAGETDATAADSLLLYDGTIVHLGTLGTAIAELAEQPIGIETLAHELQQRFGAPPEDLLKATHEAVAHLIDQAVLQVVDSGDPSAELGWQVSERAAYVASSPERVVVLNLDRPAEQPLAILGSGAAIWHELMPPEGTLERPIRRDSELLERLAERYGCAQESISADVQNFLAELVDRGLIQRSTDVAGTTQAMPPSREAPPGRPGSQ